MPVANGQFETAGATPGSAASWTLAATAAGTDIAEHDTSDEGTEDFEEGWTLPMGSPGSTAMGTFNTTTGAFVDGAAVAAGPLLQLVARVTTAFVGGPVQLNITYTDNVNGAGRIGTVVIPANAAIGDNQNVTLQAGDQQPLDVTAIAENVPFAGPGVVEILGFRELTWCEGSFGCRMASGNATNEASLFAFTEAGLARVTFTHGQQFEGFEHAWSGNAGIVLNNFDALVSDAAEFDLNPLIPSSTTSAVEDFEHGWYLPNADTVALGNYRVSDNTFVDGVAATAQADGAYSLPHYARARVTEAFENLEMNFDIAYRDQAGGPVREADLTILASALVNQQFNLVPRTAGGPEELTPYDLVAHDAGPFVGLVVGEENPSAIRGRFDVLVDELPVTTRLNAAVFIQSLSARLTIGAGAGAVLYESRLLGLAGEVVRVAHVAGAPSTPTTTVAAVANDVTVTLRTNAAGAILATAAEVATAVNQSAGGSPLVIAAAQAGGAGVVSPLALTFLNADTDAVQADFDAANQDFEDFEQEWSNNQASLSAFTIATAGSQTYYRELNLALFSSPTLLATFTVPAAFVDGGTMPQPPFSPYMVGIITALWTQDGGAADPRVTYAGTAQVGGAFSTAPVGTHLDQILVGGTNVLPAPLGWSNIFDMTGMSQADAIAPFGNGYTAGAMQVWGGEIAETFEANWTDSLD